MKRLNLTVELLEDLHIGTGTGVGDIDARQVRDRYGRPVLPASHIKGVLRETALEASRLQPGAFSREKINTLFGQGGGERGRLLLTSGYWHEKNSSRLLIWGSTRIDENGTAQEKSLRFVEYVPAGSRFALEAEVPEEDETFFRALLAHTPYLGAQRTRGHGRVRWQIEEPPPAPPILPEGLPHHYPAKLRLVLRNDDPLCLPLTAHPGNLITTTTAIRGRALRGSVAALCLDAGLEEAAATLLSPTLSWGDGRPLPASETHLDRWQRWEVVPIPRSIGTPKGKAERADIPWWVSKKGSETPLGAQGEVEQIAKRWAEEQKGANKTQRDSEKLKRPKEEEWLFRTAPDAPWIRYRVMRLERLHTRPPKPDEGLPEQALFSTEEIAERTLFIADLIVSNQAEAEALTSALTAMRDRWLRLGRGGRPVRLLAAGWSDLPEPTPQSDQGVLYLFLESDLILRNRYGNFATQLDAKLLAEALGLANAQVTTFAAFCDTAPVYGFNAMTGLPRSAQQAILAGSAIAITGNDLPKLTAALRTKVALGESAEEGFGRFRLEIPQPERETIATPRSAVPHTSREEELAQKGWEYANQLRKIKPLPSRSQWGELRARALAARTPEELHTLFARIDEASAKLGGKSWLGLTQSDEWKRLREEVQSLPFAEGQKLLDYLVRWVRALDNQTKGEAR